MPGAVIGDVIGPVYGFRARKSREFPPFGAKSDFTEDIRRLTP